MLFLILIINCLFFLASHCLNYGEIPTIDEEGACTPFKGHFIINQTFGYIQSPKYDSTGIHPYQKNINCSWTIIAPPKHVIWMKTMIMDLEEECKGGYISFYDGVNENSSFIDKFCGQRFRNFRSPNRTIHIKFVAGEPIPNVVQQYNGFVLYFEAQRLPIHCRKNLKKCRNLEKCFTSSQSCDGKYNCLDGTDEENCTYILRDFEKNCGESKNENHESLSFRVVGGAPVEPNSWPWQVSLRLLSKEPDGHKCGAVIVNREWIITAAHCFKTIPDYKDWTVHFAKHRKVIRDETEILRFIKQLVIHPEYDPNMRENDFAMIKINAPLPYNNPNISAICLPKKTDYSNISQIDVMTIIGWGKTQDSGYPYVLKEAKVTLSSTRYCSESINSLKLSPKKICISYNESGADTCHGDSGGPMMWKNNKTGRWQILAITSFGSTCCGCKKSIAIFTLVEPYLEWIKKVISEYSKSQIN